MKNYIIIFTSAIAGHTSEVPQEIIALVQGDAGGAVLEVAGRFLGFLNEQVVGNADRQLILGRQYRSRWCPPGG